MVFKVMTGDYAAALSAKVTRAQVIAAYPITPQTLIVEHISEFVDNGELDAEYIRAESEHSAMSMCMGSQVTGARSYTATSSQGLAYMHELLFIAAPLRLPIYMAVVNRTLAAPIAIWNEFNDTMPERDSGWIQSYAENNQEVLDMAIEGYKIAENDNVLLPMMTGLDAFILSHTVEPVDVPDQNIVDKFLPKFKAKFGKIDPDDPMMVGSFTPPEYIMEFRKQTDTAMENSKKVIRDVTKEFAKTFGRDYHGLVEEYRMDDAEVALVTVGSVTSTSREVIDDYRKEGKKVGLLKLRYFRPFPVEEVRKVAEKVKAFGVIDKSVSFVSGGNIYQDMRAALYGYNVPIVDFMAGLGGRDIPTTDIKKMLDITMKAAKDPKSVKPINWIATRGC